MSVLRETEPATLAPRDSARALASSRGHLLERACEDDGLAGDGRVRLGLLGVGDLEFGHQVGDDAAIVRLAEIGRGRGDHRLADLVEGVEIGPRLLVTLRDAIHGGPEK